MKFSKEEIRSRVFVPPSIEIELKRLIENKLDQTGLFYRVFSRTKTPSSFERKYNKKNYNEDKKIQDLIGIRINLYFQDDLKIVKSLMENLFTKIEWSENQVDTTRFEPIKINGVFRLPAYLVAKISETTWDMAIDQTFEIQLKTVFFEGWHEVEHDMRYKNQKLWEQYESYSRRFNSIVATLELCDRSMIDIFEDMAHSLYKDNDWAGMIRMHYRIRISEQDIYEEFIPILEQNQKEIGKKLLKYKRADLMEYLSSFYRDIPISVNMIIALINDRDFQNPVIKDIARNHRVYRDGISYFEYEKRKRVLRKMENYLVYNNRLTVYANKYNQQELFEKISDTMYSWLNNKYIAVFERLPEKKCSQSLIDNGYKVKVTAEDGVFEIRTSHVDQMIAGRIWHTYGRVQIENNELRLVVNNAISDINEVTEEEQINNFSAPGFLNETCRDSSIYIRDVVRMTDNPRMIDSSAKEQEELQSLICNSERFHPVVVIVYDKADELLDKSWLSEYWGADLARAVKYYAHVYETDAINSHIHDKGIYLFSQACKAIDEYEYFSVEIVNNWKQTPGDNGILRSRDTEGSKAFMNHLIREIKRKNINYTN